MIDRQTLFEQFEQFLDTLQTNPLTPDYLEAEPEAIAPFDPYQLVAEWIALRHEVKQQGKVLQASQTTLQQALEALQFEKEQSNQPPVPTPSLDATQTDQKPLLRDLLTVLDSLDQASAHWQSQLDELSDNLSMAKPPQPIAQPFWKQWFQPIAQSPTATTDPVQDVLLSNQQGIELIRRSLLDILRQRQVTPMEAKGKPFNAQIMYAIGRQESASVPENTVIQEVVRGYWWGDRVLREAQVIVAVKQG